MMKEGWKEESARPPFIDGRHDRLRNCCLVNFVFGRYRASHLAGTMETQRLD